MLSSLPTTMQSIPGKKLNTNLWSDLNIIKGHNTLVVTHKLKNRHTTQKHHKTITL